MTDANLQLSEADHDAETRRLDELYSLQILDTPEEARFDQYTTLLTSIFDMPVATLSLVDVDRLWFKSKVGLDHQIEHRIAGFCEQSFCKHVSRVGYCQIDDALCDPQFSDSPLVTGQPHVRFYAGAALYGPTGEAVGSLCVVDTRPRTFTKRQKEQLLTFARLVEFELNDHQRDQLTALPDARQVRTLLSHKLAHARGQSAPLVVVKVQLGNRNAQDPARDPNHHEDVMLSVADQLRMLVNSTDHVGRLGRNCFSIIAAGQETLGAIEKRFGRILAAIDLPMRPGELSSPLTLSAGGARFPDDAGSCDGLIHQANEAARYADSCGKPRQVVFHGRITNNPLARRDALATRLGEAVRAGRIVQHYQPVFDCRSNRMMAVEALARWHDPEYGAISPAEFVPIVESDIALRQAFTALTIRQACERLALWALREIDLSIAVNIPGAEFHRPGFVESVLDALEAHDVAPDRLLLELTEGCLITDFATARTTIERLRAAGVRFAIDDFGTGYSSLAYLRRLPLEELKIDRSFIADMQTSAEAAGLVRNIVDIARTLNMAVVAEGIETAPQYDQLRAMGCEYAQGFALGRPSDAAAIEKQLVA